MNVVLFVVVIGRKTYVETSNTIFNLRNEKMPEKCSDRLNKRDVGNLKVYIIG